MDEIIIYEYQLKAILEALRITSNIHNCSKGETCHDRQVRQAHAYAENALNGEHKTEVNYNTGKSTPYKNEKSPVPKPISDAKNELPVFSIKDIPLPPFLNEKDGEIYICYHGETDVTDEYNVWLEEHFNSAHKFNLTNQKLIEMAKVITDKQKAAKEHLSSSINYILLEEMWFDWLKEEINGLDDEDLHPRKTQ